MERYPRSSPTPAATHRSASSRGFSLIEVLGTMAVITILAVALVPVLVREFDRLARDSETRQLALLSNGLKNHILRNRTIPDHTGFANAIATELGIQITDVLLNEHRQPRVLLFDPAVTNALVLPFTQTANGIASAVPISLGVILLSSLSEPLPPGIVSGYASSAAAFSNVWNAAENSIPSGWSWNGRGEDLRIARLNLGTLFVPLALNYEAYLTGITNRGRYTIDGSTTNTLPTSPVFVANYIIGTVIGLHHHAGTANTLQATVVLQNPASYFYQGSVWRGQAFLGRGMRPTGAMDLQAAHDVFIASPANDEAQGNPPATPAIIVAAMTAYLQEYIEWRDAGYPNSHRDLDDAHDALDRVTSDLLHHPSR